MLDRKRDLGLAVDFVYLPSEFACEQVCATAAAVGVHCYELANNFVLEWLFLS